MRSHSAGHQWLLDLHGQCSHRVGLIKIVPTDLFRFYFLTDVRHNRNSLRSETPDSSDRMGNPPNIVDMNQSGAHLLKQGPEVIYPQPTHERRKPFPPRGQYE